MKFEETVLGKKMLHAIKADIFSEYEAIAIYLCLKYINKNNVPIGDFWDKDVARLLQKYGT